MKVLASLTLTVTTVSSLYGALPIPMFAQVKPAQGQVVLSNLSPPIYPPLARAARITGEVEIALEIRRDGSVVSAKVVKGHPLLKSAALDSARLSKFECHECGEAPSSYLVVYTFGFTTDTQCCQSKISAAAKEHTEAQSGISQIKNHITVLSEPLCICDPREDIIKVRSVKCLFLWHCSRRYGM